jgi:pantoate--beta-alanine ligase
LSGPPRKALVALGSNLGDRQANLDAALAALRREPGLRVIASSTWIETDPVGGPPGQGRYLNGAIAIETALAPRELLGRLLEIERRAGRDRSLEPRNGPRRLDLDLLLYGDERIDEPGLRVPHPRLEERLFVLEPLAQIAPDARLASGRSVRERLAELRAEAVPSATRAILRCSDPERARRWCDAERAAGRAIGFVPTMGALHEGHLELVRRARAENNRCAVSIFVNPLQFDDPADLARYPRDFERDAAELEREGCDMVFTGTLEQFFPEAGGRREAIGWREPGPAAEGLEGELRPGHFRGVATIVARLFEIVRPARAYFGEKDFQQTRVVRDLARELGYPEIVVCPTSREPSGLALSSRNARLDPDERERALAIVRALEAARRAWLERGLREPAALREAMLAVLAPSGLEVEYAEVRDPERWTALEPAGPLVRALALVAARAGGVRLIDNLRLDRAPSEEA